MRHGGKSDYPPCTAWSSADETASCWRVGTVTGIDVRPQSNVYVKQTGLGKEEKTAWEVSVSSFFAI